MRQLLEETQELQVIGHGRQTPKVVLRNMLAGHEQVLVIAASIRKSVRQEEQVPLVQLEAQSCGHDCAPITTRRAISAMIILEEIIFNIIIYVLKDDEFQMRGAYTWFGHFRLTNTDGGRTEERRDGVDLLLLRGFQQAS